ncbi:hypothetical protein ACQ4PT_027117 [Festuca glaucescens]
MTTAAGPSSTTAGFLPASLAALLNMQMDINAQLPRPIGTLSVGLQYPSPPAFSARPAIPAISDGSVPSSTAPPPAIASAPLPAPHLPLGVTTGRRPGTTGRCFAVPVYGSVRAAACRSPQIIRPSNSLTCSFIDGPYRPVLARWFQLLATKGVDALVFVNRLWPVRGLRLPSSLFSCASLRRLWIGAWVFPNTTTLPRGAAFPNLRELVLGCAVMEDKDLEFVLAVSPVLDILAIAGSQTQLHARLSKSSLRCAQFCLSILEEVAVVDAPSLECLFLWHNKTLNRTSTTVKIGHAPKLRFLGYLEPGRHTLQIGDTVIKSKETLHPTSKLSVKFWKGTGPIECVQSHLKTLIFVELQGDRNEFKFLKSIVENAEKLEVMYIEVKHGLSYIAG